MSATNSQSDKFLFLFNTDNTYDLTPVRDAFHGYYNYSSGGANTFEATGCDNFNSTFKAMLDKIIVNNPSGLTPNGETSMNTLVIVIMGYADGNGIADSSSATIAKHISWAVIRDCISGIVGPSQYPYTLNTEVHVVCLTNYCNSLASEWDGNVPVSSGTLLIPATSLNAISPVSGPAFLSNWTSHLMLSTGLSLDPDGRISFNQIAAAIHAGNTSNYFRSVGPGISGNYFPGYHKLEIADGSPNFWESTDIKLEHPLDTSSYGAGYEYGYLQDNQTTIRNNVLVKTTNSGTHPLRNFKIDLGMYLQNMMIPGPPHRSKLKIGGFIKAGETVESKLTDVSFQFPDFINLVVAVNFTDTVDFSNVDISANKNEAQRTIALIHESLDFSTTIQNVTPVGGSNGEIKVDGFGGRLPYTCSCTGQADKPANPSCTFSGLSAGTKTIVLKDSSSIQLSCTKNVTLSESNPSDPGTIVCDPRLDTQYISIWRCADGSVKIYFKAYPLQPSISRFRYYKMRWKISGLNGNEPTQPPVDMRLSNIVITGTGTEMVGGTHFSYIALRIPCVQAGSMVMKHRLSFWPFGRMRIELDTEILYKKFIKFNLFNTFLSIAKFKLIIYNTGLDARVNP